MSLPSFQLSKRDGRWIATADVGFKKPVEISCGDGSRKAAEEVARRELKRKHQLAEAGRIRWRQHRADKAAAKVARANGVNHAPAPAAADEVPPKPLTDDDDAPAERDPDPQPSPGPSRAAEIAGRLRELGAGDGPIEPDHIQRPGEIPDEHDAGDAGDAPIDNEAGELLADIIAAAAVAGHVKLIAKYLKKRRPPLRPGEPHEKMLEWERDGLSYNIARLVGKTTTMGPTGKMLVGAAFMTIGMLVDAEPIEGAAGTAPAASSSSSSSPAPAPAAAEPSDEEKAPPVQTTALGRFA
jgi:hypothetical protein